MKSLNKQVKTTGILGNGIHESILIKGSMRSSSLRISDN